MRIAFVPAAAVSVILCAVRMYRMRVDGWMDDERADGWTDLRMDGRMYGWMGGWMDGPPAICHRTEDSKHAGIDDARHPAWGFFQNTRQLLLLLTIYIQVKESGDWTTIWCKR